MGYLMSRMPAITCFLLTSLFADVAVAQVLPPPSFDLFEDALPQGAVARLGNLRFQMARRESAASPDWRFGLLEDSFSFLTPDGSEIVTASGFWQGKVRFDYLSTSSGKLLRHMELPKKVGQPACLSSSRNEVVFFGGNSVFWVDVEQGRAAKGPTLRQKESFLVLPVLAVSRDGKLLAYQKNADANKTPVVVVDAVSGKEQKSIIARGSKSQRMLFSPDGKRVLLSSVVPEWLGDKDGPNKGGILVLTCLDLEKNKVAGEHSIPHGLPATLSPDGETVAFETAKHDGIVVLHLPSKQTKFVLDTKCSKFEFSPDGKLLVTLDTDGKASIWNALHGSLIRKLDGQMANEDFRIVGFSTDSKIVAAIDGGWSSAARFVVWDVDTGKRRQAPPGHESRVSSLAYSPNGQFLITGSLDRTVRLWRAATAEHLAVLANHEDEITAVSFSADGSQAASSSKSGEVQVSEVPSGRTIAHFRVERAAQKLAFTDDGKRLLFGGQERRNKIHCWDIGLSKELHQTNLFDHEVIAISPGGTRALGSRGELLNLETKKSQTRLPLEIKEKGQVGCEAAAFSLDCRLIATSQVSAVQRIRPSYEDGALRVWETSTGQEIRKLSAAVTQAVAFSPNGRYLASGTPGEPGHQWHGYGTGIDLWDVLSGKKIGGLPTSTICMAFSPDGKHLATGDSQNGVLVWKVPDAKVAAARFAPESLRDAWWPKLAGTSTEAYSAIGEMLDWPEDGVTCVRRHLSRSDGIEPKAIKGLLEKLRAGSYAERAEAQAALEGMAERAMETIAAELPKDASPEMRRRLESLKAKGEATSSVNLRVHRAVAFLEMCRTPSARALLGAYASGTQGTRLTAEAEQASKRLGRQSSPAAK